MNTQTKARSMAPNLREACERHAEVKSACERSLQGVRHDLAGLWLELTGQFPADVTSADLVDAARWTVPVELLPILQGGGTDVVAAFAFTLACSAIASIAADDRVALRDAMSAVWVAVLQRAAQGAAIEEGFGCDQSAAWATMRRVERAGGPSMLRKMLTISQLAGRMHSAMQVVSRPIPTEDPQSITGVERGGQLERLMPGELAKLTVGGGLGDMQAMRILRKTAEQREMKGETQKGQGPMVLVRDSSSSMHDQAEQGIPGRNSWAAACTLALARLAHGENRRVSAVHFSRVTRTADVTNDGASLEDLVMTHLGGGTSFVPALAVALREVKRLEREGHPGADIVYITDGEEDYGNTERPKLDALLDEAKRDGVRLWTVGIGEDLAVDFPLRARAERYVSAHDQTLTSRPRAVQLAAELTAAAVADSARWN